MVSLNHKYRTGDLHIFNGPNTPGTGIIHGSNMLFSLDAIITWLGLIDKIDCRHCWGWGGAISSPP